MKDMYKRKEIADHVVTLIDQEWLARERECCADEQRVEVRRQIFNNCILEYTVIVNVDGSDDSGSAFLAQNLITAQFGERDSGLFRKDKSYRLYKIDDGSITMCDDIHVSSDMNIDLLDNHTVEVTKLW